MNPDGALNKNIGISIRLFVYGTLKKGFRNHDHFCRSAVDIQPATTWGRLYELPAGYPAIEVPEPSILVHGTADPLADAEIQIQIDATALIFSRPIGDWDLIHGELVTFTDPLCDLPPVDRLEGFRPRDDSMYRRVLVTVTSGQMPCTAWIYDGSPMKPRLFPRILRGVWKGISSR
jgi:gamma-glutamylcyclotransferase (GGCT)/AIG2-like uncharacterized protein YtfP